MIVGLHIGQGVGHNEKLGYNVIFRIKLWRQKNDDKKI